MKKKNGLFILGVFFLTGIYLFLRLYKFEEKTIYQLDQGLHLLESWKMVENRDIKLIGPMVSSKTFMDRGFFIGPQYYYVLAFLGIITKWNPILIDIILLFLELGLILFLINWIKKKFGTVEALTAFGLLTFSRFFIIHSRFFWNPHFLLPLGILAVISIIEYIRSSKIKYLWFLGGLWGLAFGFHYAAILWGIPILILLLINKKFLKWQTFVALPVGFILGNLPWFIFELRNNFYNIKTIWWIMTQTKISGKMESHYFIYPLVIFMLVGLVWCLNKIKNKKNKIVLSLGLVLMISLIQIKYMPLGNLYGGNYLITKDIVKRILKDECPKDFNIATTTSGDTRAYDLRFLLTKDGCEPMEVDKYPEAKTLFLVSPNDRPPETETVWEVSSLGKFKIKREEKLNEMMRFYELVKII